MKLENIKQPPFNVSLMGVVKGVLEHYGFKTSAAMAYGGSGHAFLINVHEVICPSGPYVWKYDGFFRLLRNLGLEMIELGFIHGRSTSEERARIEQAVRQHLDLKEPCSIVNMDNQIIIGHEGNHLVLTQPWPCVTDITPVTLSYGSWVEFGREIHASLFAYRKVAPAPLNKVIRDSLEYAVGLFDDPGKHAVPKYGIGGQAYDNWILGVQNGHGSSHGNWWNGTVWSECRSRAADYFAEIADRIPAAAAPARELGTAYQGIAAGLDRISEKEMKPEEKIKIIKELKDRELRAVKSIKSLLNFIPT